MPEPARTIRHHFTVDVEEYFQVAALTSAVTRASWDDRPSRLAVGMRVLLDTLAEHETRGTFFVLGWIAERHRRLMTELVAAGHEIASHGWGHERVTILTPEAFRASVRDSRRKLEDLSGTGVYGYRAPSFSIVRGGEWALEILAEEGYRYDSSLYPVRRPGYGFAGGRRDPHQIQTPRGPLDELPPATVRFASAVLPAGGGAYLRLFPYRLVRSAFAEAEERGVPATFYIHPWELDPEQPRLDVSMLTRIRHYGGLRRTEPRIRQLLADFAFQPIAETLGLTHALAARS